VAAISKPIYQIWQTPYAKGSFQQMISEAKAAIDALLK
jgi:thiaminase